MTRSLSILLAILLFTVVFLGWRLLRAHESIGAGSEMIAVKDSEIIRLNGQLESVNLIARMNESFQAELQRKGETITTASTNRAVNTHEVLNGKTENKAWADARLPPDIIRLHLRPTLIGASDYLQYLPKDNALRVTGQQSED